MKEKCLVLQSSIADSDKQISQTLTNLFENEKSNSIRQSLIGEFNLFLLKKIEMNMVQIKLCVIK